MVPVEKVKDIIDKYDLLKKNYHQEATDPKLFAKKSKEYSRLGRIILNSKRICKF